MARARSSPATLPAETREDTPADRLQATVVELAQNVRVLTDIVDQLREDLSWLTRNGVPHQPLHVFVQRVPLVTAGEGSGGSVEMSFSTWPSRDPTAATLSDDDVRSAVIDDVVQRLAEPLGQLAQEQLNALLTVMDHAHREVLQAIRAPRTTVPQEAATPKSSPRRTRKRSEPPAASTAPAEPAAPPGQLF